MSSLFNLPANTNNNSNNTPASDRPKAQVWLNVGYEVEVPAEDGSAEKVFVSLPMGIPVDTMEQARVNGTDRWKQFQGARNDLLGQIQELAKGMTPGTEQTINLKVQIRRVTEDNAPATANPFGFNLTAL